MAELNRETLVTIAATTALTLTTSRKLIRNFKYYKSSNREEVSRVELLALCKKSRMDVFGMVNLIANNDPEMDPFLISLAGRIFDQLEELHRKLLFFDPDHISEIIPLIDEQRRFWSDLTDEHFYCDHLLRDLENKVSGQMFKINKMIRNLPESVSTT